MWVYYIYIYIYHSLWQSASALVFFFPLSFARMGVPQLHHKWPSHVTNERVMTQINESCHKWTSHVANERVMTHMGVVCIYFRFLSLAGVSLSHVTNERVTSQMNESCRKGLSRDTWVLRVFTICFFRSQGCQWVMSQMNESRLK